MNKDQKIKLSKNLAIISGIMALFVGLLLLLNFYQLSSHDPIESKTLDALVQRLSEEPNNEELIREIRNYDLLARKAYFNAQWQVKTGGYLLLAFSVMLVIALRIYYSLTEKIEHPNEQLENQNLRKLLAQKWVIGAGSTVIVLSMIAAIVSNQHYVSYSQANIAETSEKTSGEEEVEVIDVVSEEPDAGEEEKTGDTEAEKGQATESAGEKQAEKQVEESFTPAQTPAQNQAAEKADEEKQTSDKPVEFPSAEAIKNNHNAFRGPFGNGISYHTNIPTKWDGASGENILWKKEIQKPGYNSPVIWEDKLFISGGDKESRVVYCYNRHTGELLWQKAADNIPGSPDKMPKTTDDTGLAAPTLTTDGNGVYAIFATGDVIAFDMEGNRLWAKNLGVPDNHYGHSSSLISWKEKLFIQYDTNEGGKIITLNLLNGNLEWEKQRDSRISWASPILAQMDGNLQLILSAVPIVAGYNIENGEQIWEVECMMGEVGPSPAYSDGYIFAANEYATLAAINADNDYQIAWENSEYLPEVASPVVRNGLLFIATSYGVLVCYDAKSGEKYWEQEFGEGFYSSPMIADEKLYIIDMGGNGHIISVSKEYNKIAGPELGEKVFATPAFAEDRIYIRGEKNLYCIGK